MSIAAFHLLQSTDLLCFLVLKTRNYTNKKFRKFRSREAYNQMVSLWIKSVKGHVIWDNPHCLSHYLFTCWTEINDKKKNIYKTGNASYIYTHWKEYPHVSGVVEHVHRRKSFLSPSAKWPQDLPNPLPKWSGILWKIKTTRALKIRTTFISLPLLTRWFFARGEKNSDQRKSSQSSVKNQNNLKQHNDTEPENRIWVTMCSYSKKSSTFDIMTSICFVSINYHIIYFSLPRYH